MKKAFFLLAVFVFFGCNKNSIYKQFDRNFKDNRWFRSDVRNFEFKIEDGGKNYDLLFDFSHVDGFQFNNIPVKIDITNPEGSLATEDFLLKINDPEGHALGECAGDYCDIQQPVLENAKLAPGKYKISISNGFNKDYLPNVLGLGIVLNLSKKQ